MKRAQLHSFSLLDPGPLESESSSVVSDSLTSHSPWNSPGQKTGVGSLSVLQGIFPAPRSNPGLPHCRRILYQLSYKSSPSQQAGQELWSPGEASNSVEQRGASSQGRAQQERHIAQLSLGWSGLHAACAAYIF